LQFQDAATVAQEDDGKRMVEPVDCHPSHARALGDALDG
jgi:hypothetical protein